MQTLLPLAAEIALLVKQRKQTIVVAESSTGGLISAALLAVPGASAYFLGGATIYTRLARQVLLDIPDATVNGMRASTEAFALIAARTMRERFAADWAIAETGAAGPTGNRYGDSAGHSCIAVAGGGGVEQAITLETGSADRLANMRAFALAALELLHRRLKLTMRS
jgi:nicotinamide-nucleotide amidase